MTELERWADADTRLSLLFDRVLLTDLRQLFSQFSRSAYTTLAALPSPAPPILAVLKAVVLLVQPDLSTGDLDWTHCQTVSTYTYTHTYTRLMAFLPGYLDFTEARDSE